MNAGPYPAAMPRPASQLKLVDEYPTAAHIELLYWDNKNLGFGHVATVVHGGGASAEPLFYISYAMGNHYATDRDKHGKDPVRLQFPGRTPEQLAAFERWYTSSGYGDTESPSYGQDYNILTHNCAHAILEVLSAFGYDLGIVGAPVALLPVQVYHAAQKYAAEHPDVAGPRHSLGKSLDVQ